MTESKLLVEAKDVVVPGQVLAQGIDYLPSDGTYRLNDEIRANQVGLLIVDGKVLRTIPLVGRYVPKCDDVVIGRVEDVLMSGWRFAINGPYSAVLPLKDASFDYIRKGEDLTTYFDIEDYVALKITQVTSQNLIDVTVRAPGLKKLDGGRILEVNALKIPRIVGKRGSMISMIKSATDCDIVVGQNGIIWINGEASSEVLAVQTIKMVEKQAHIPGLTERIKKHLEKVTGKPVEIREEPVETHAPRQERSSSYGERSQSYGDRDRRPPQREGANNGNRSGGFNKGPRSPRRE